MVHSTPSAASAACSSAWTSATVRAGTSAMRRASPLLRSTISSDENTSSDASTDVPRQGIGPVVTPRADNSSAVNIQFGCAGESARRSLPSICA